MINNQLTNPERIEVVESLIGSHQNILSRYQDKLENFDILDKSLLENKLSKDGLSYEIERINEIVGILNAYKETLK